MHEHNIEVSVVLKVCLEVFI